MPKTIAIAINELRVGIEKAIKESGLPSSVIEPILCNYWLQFKSSSEAQLREDIQKSKEGEEDNAKK